MRTSKAILPCIAAPLLVVAACSSTALQPVSDAGAEAGGGSPSQCTAARKTHLTPVAKVSTGTVKVISTAGGVTKIYVDAAAGGTPVASQNPRVYIKLSGERIDLTDDDAFASADWDLALKRVDIFTNSGDAGPGKGGAAIVGKDFAAVTAADADAAPVAPEKFFDADCNGLKDEASFIITSFTGWYDYQVGGTVTPKANTTFIVKGADGTRYKLKIASYNARADGTTNNVASGFFLLWVAPV
jgi:hypothetical protein